jgi:hypothetical protein
MKRNNKHVINCLMTKLTVLAFAASLVTLPSQRASAFIPPQDSCIDVHSIVVMQPLNDSLITKQMVSTYMPTNLTPTTDPNRFASQFEASLGQKITDQLMKSPMFKNSSIGQVTSSFEKVTQQSFTYHPDQGVAQKFNIAVKAAERTASLNYEGFFKSSLTYASNASNMVWTVSKAVGQATTLSLTNTTPVGTFSPSSMISLSHSF